MDNFHRFIKKNIKNEKTKVPDSFNKRLDEVIASLPNEKSNRKPKPIKQIVAASLALCLIGGVAAKTPIVQAAVSNIVSYFAGKADSAFIGDKEVVEKFNKAVGASVEDKGIKVTLDNIMADDNFLMAYYTITSEKVIEVPTLKDENKLFGELFLAPIFEYKVNGKEVKSLNNNNQECYLLNDKTLKVVTRENISGNSVPTKFNISISTDEIFKTKGTWNLETSLDKNDIAKETKTATPKIKTTLDFGLFKREANINKVSISPLGNQINVDSDIPLPSFALIDPKGNYLEVLNTDERDGNNSYEFLKGSKDMEYIDLVPIKASDERDLNTEVFNNITKEPIILQANNKGKVIVEDINFSKDRVTIKYRHEGLTGHIGEFSFADKAGNHIDLGDCAVFDSIDRSTNTYTTTYRFYNPNVDYSKVSKIGTWLPKEITLMNGSKVRIPLK